MLAHHPVSGKPIHILRTDAQISSDSKTLLWVKKTFAANERYQRYYILITEPEALELCGPNVCAVLLTADADLDAWIKVFPKLFVSGRKPLLIGAEEQFDAFAAKGYAFDDALFIEELYDTFPYLGEPVQPTDPVEKIILSVAHILRVNRIIWSSSSLRDSYEFSTRAQYDAWTSSCSGTILQIPTTADDSFIPQTWLIQQYFEPSNARRAREILCCLQKNVECPLIDHILLLNEAEFASLPKIEKIKTRVIGHRLTYYDVLKTAKEVVPDGAFIVFANSDIWFNDTLAFLWRIGLEKRLFLALLRWEDTAGTGKPSIFGPRADSQDSWILARSCLDFEPTVEEFGFPFGKSGCDNAIALLMLRKKFLVVNPAYSIHTMHMHSSNVRNYDPKDVLYKPHYLYVEPTPIQFCKVVSDLVDKAKLPDAIKNGWAALNIHESFRRPIESVEEIDAKTMCTMLRHGESDYTLSAGNENLWTPPPKKTPLYHLDGGTFTTFNGLVSNFQEIFVGKHEHWKRKWEETHQSSLMPSIHVPSLLALPVEEESVKSLGHWVLHYLPRALAIQKILTAAKEEAPEFLIPRVDGITDFLSDCSFSKKPVVVPMMAEMNYYSEKAWAVPPEEGAHFVSKEDIASLRGLVPTLGEKQKQAETPIAVFCVEDAASAVCTRGWAEEVADKILGVGWTVRYISSTDPPSARRRAFADASWIFGSGEALWWIWYAPVGATVMEFIRDTEVRGDIVHLAGAAGLRYVLGLVKREPIETQRQNALMEVHRAIKKFGFDAKLKSVRAAKKGVMNPIVVLPSGEALKGIWNHSGDTFREMAEIWEERGYVELQRNESTGFCWWGGVGQVLLYDRPTARWWSTIPTYQMALFGNCAPPGPAPHLLRQSIWSFWPRSPRAIEAVAAAGENGKDYSARTIPSLFLGKVENGVQMAHRTGKDWSKAVSLFSMPIDSTGKPYPYTQKEYLEKLCSARYGLCLPGFGPKCNREIEYFACGVVPIVTPGVDMKGYLVPPREGVHYFTASTPEEVQTIVKETPAVKWALMSTAGREWWRTYASAEGLFRLTWARIEQCQPYLQVGIPKYFLS